MFTVIETTTFVRLAGNCWNDEDRTNFIPFYGKSMRENIPTHVLRQIKEEIENA